ncbi:MAG: HAD family phosphatase [Bacteroidia bacterium]
MQKKDTIIFDLGGVLIDRNPRYLYRKIFDDEGEMEWVSSKSATIPWNIAQDTAAVLREATNASHPRFPEYESEISAYFSRWSEMIGGHYQDVVKIQQSLIKNPAYRVVALTNWSSQTFPWALRNFPFLHDFEGILVSGEEKLAKPDPAIYQLLLKRFNIDPDRAIFIDDSAKNIAGAWKEGITGHRYTDPERLEEYLAKMGIEAF